MSDIQDPEIEEGSPEADLVGDYNHETYVHLPRGLQEVRSKLVRNVVGPVRGAQVQDDDTELRPPFSPNKKKTYILTVLFNKKCRK